MRCRHNIDLLQTTRRFLRIWRCLLFFQLLQGQAYGADLIMFCIISKFTQDGHGFPGVWVGKIPVTSFTTTIHETRPFRFSD